MHRGIWQGFVPILMVIGCLGFGTWGFQNSTLINAGDPITLTGQEAFWLATGLPLLETTSYPDPGSEVSWQLNAARTLGVLIPPYAFFLLLSALLGDWLKYARIWAWKFLPRRPYVVVVGMGWIGGELLQDLSRNYKYNVVAIDKDEGNLRSWSLKSRHVICIQADATSREVLERLDVGRASKIYVVCDSDETNCWIIDQIASLRRPSSIERDHPACYVHILDDRKRFHVSRLRKSQAGRLNVACFNVYDTTARKLYSEHPNYRFADRSEEPEGVRIVIMGYTPMGKAILLQCLRAGHFPDNQLQTIVVITKNPGEAKADFEAEFPFLSPSFREGQPDLEAVSNYAFPSGEVRFVQLPRSDSELLRQDSEVARELDGKCPMSLYVCLDDGLRSAAYARIIAEKVDNLLEERGAGELSITYRLFLYYNIPQEEQVERIEGLRTLLEEEYRHLEWRPFGDLLENCSAKIIEAEDLDLQATRINAIFENAPLSGAEERWKSLIEEIRESNRQAADHITVKLRCFGLDPEQLDLSEQLKSHEQQLAEMEHRRWCAEKLLDGWLPLEMTEENKSAWDDPNGKNFRTGKKKQKLHRVLVPYAALPTLEKKKNLEQVAAIPRVLRG